MRIGDEPAEFAPSLGGDGDPPDPIAIGGSRLNAEQSARGRRG